MEALKTYKESDELLDFLAKATALLTPDPNTHRLLRGLSYRIFGCVCVCISVLCLC
ncbi:hypothetical protein AALO_G00059130, partial [Alosa alosa]